MSCLNNIKIGNDPISTVFHGESTGNYAQSMVFVRAQEESDREPSILFFFFLIFAQNVLQNRQDL